MPKDAYIALIRKESETIYGVDFPDFPGCVSGGETLKEALANAREALALHIEALLENREEIPQSSDMESVLADAHNRNALAVLIEVPRIRGRTVRVNVTLDEHLLRRIEAVARNRSAFLAEAAEAELNRRERERETSPVFVHAVVES